jgi:hypothetical protein
MKIEDAVPAHCYARAQRLLGELDLVRIRMGRAKDVRPLPEVMNASPREVYFQAIAAWHNVTRLAAEVGARGVRPAPAVPALQQLRPGHVLQLIDAVLDRVGHIKKSLEVTDSVQEQPIDPSRKSSDVLVTLLRANRELARVLERPFTPSDAYRAVALASAYASRAGGTADLAPFERDRKPADCYARLETCLAACCAAITKKGQPALGLRGTPPDVQPSDVYDLAMLVLGEVAFLHSLVGGAPPVHAFEPGGEGHRLPSHVYQIARTLEAQLAALS